MYGGQVRQVGTAEQSLVFTHILIERITVTVRWHALNYVSTYRVLGCSLSLVLQDWFWWFNIHTAMHYSQEQHCSSKTLFSKRQNVCSLTTPATNNRRLKPHNSV